MEGVLGVRKGAWTNEEDILLRQCIATYGEGKWHQIPHKAGLNRCRKSCRLRWLNYLKPNIKRGVFEEDEVDLMIKLHKLLGNSGLPNDPGGVSSPEDCRGEHVKNYWNTHLREKEENYGEKGSLKFSFSKSVYRPKVIRPQPRNFSKSFILRCQQARPRELEQRKEKPSVSSPSPSPSEGVTEVPRSPENGKEWWETVLAEVVEDEEEGINSNETISVDGPYLGDPLKTSGEVGDCVFEEPEWNWWGEMQSDVGLDLL